METYYPAIIAIIIFMAVYGVTRIMKAFEPKEFKQEKMETEKVYKTTFKHKPPNPSPEEFTQLSSMANVPYNCATTMKIQKTSTEKNSMDTRAPVYPLHVHY